MHVLNIFHILSLSIHIQMSTILLWIKLSQRLLFDKHKSFPGFAVYFNFYTITEPIVGVCKVDEFITTQKGMYPVLFMDDSFDPIPVNLR